VICVVGTGYQQILECTRSGDIGSYGVFDLHCGKLDEKLDEEFGDKKMKTGKKINCSNLAFLKIDLSSSTVSPTKKKCCSGHVHNIV